jgi:hypothetical protein
MAEPMTARRSDNPQRVFRLTEQELADLPARDSVMIEIQVDGEWIRPARFVEKDPNAIRFID